MSPSETGTSPSRTCGHVGRYGVCNRAGQHAGLRHRYRNPDDPRFWKTDIENAKRLFPSCHMGEEEWISVLNDPHVFGSIMRDIYRAGRAEHERPQGRRPNYVPRSVDDFRATIFGNVSTT